MKTKIYSKGFDFGTEGEWLVEVLNFGERMGLRIVSHFRKGTILGFILKTSDEGEGEAVGFLNELVERCGLPARVFSAKWDLSVWCAEKGIKLVEGELLSPKVSEALEYSLIWEILHLTTSQYKKWRRSLPPHLKGIPAGKKARNGEFKKLLYGSLFFENKVDLVGLLKKGMGAWNDQNQGTGVITPTSSSSSEERADGITIENYFGQLLEEVSPIQRPLLEAIEVSFKFQAQLGLSQLEEIKRLKAKQRELLNKVKELVYYKEKSEAAKAAKELRRQNRLKRVRRQQSQPFQQEYLPWVLKFIEKKKMSNLTKTRLRIAIILLVLTGIRVSEVRNIKLRQIFQLFKRNFLTVNLSKRGSSGHKMFLSAEGQSLLSKYQGDFKSLLLLTGLIDKWSAGLAGKRNPWDIEPATLDLYLFSTNVAKGKIPISRSFFTNQINEILRETPALLERGILLTSHSFRRGYITHLWKETKDLEFVRQVIGHGQIGTTSRYVQELSDEERRQRLINL